MSAEYKIGFVQKEDARGSAYKDIDNEMGKSELMAVCIMSQFLGLSFKYT
jgi:hypothetical protein